MNQWTVPLEWNTGLAKTDIKCSKTSLNCYKSAYRKWIVTQLLC